MKCSIFLLLTFTAFFGVSKTITVDNTPFSKANYNNLQTAINSSTAGDSIIVMPSFSSYGNLSIDKKIFIYSRGAHGHKVSKDKQSVVDQVVFTNGADGSVFQGMYIPSNRMIIEQSSNISIINNFFNGSELILQTSYGTVSHILIKGNIFYQSMLTRGVVLTMNSAYYCQITNNYIVSHLEWQNYYNTYSLIVGGNSTNFFKNNLIAETESGYGFHTSAVGQPPFFRNSSMEIYNNVFWSDSPNRTRFDTTSTGANYKNNITYSRKTNPVALSGNNYNDTLPAFETDFSSTRIDLNLSYDFRLKSSSIGKNGGTDSTDVGLFGGNYWFDINTRTNGVTIIEEFEILNPIVRKGGALKVKVAARKPVQ